MDIFDQTVLGCPAGTDRNDPDSKLGCFTYQLGRIQPTYIGVK